MQTNLRFTSLISACALAFTGLAACSEQAEAPASDVASTATEANTAPAPTPPAETGGAEIDLKPLTEADLAGKLTGELGCSFIFGEVHAILVAMGNVKPEERSSAIISNGGVAEQLQSTTTGGYDGMVEGVTFGGRGMTVKIAKLEEKPTGTEQVAYTATLTAQRADGAERVYPGVWTCGP